MMSAITPRNIGGVDGWTRVFGGAALLLGALLTLPGIDGRTIETLLLWSALLIGAGALLAAFAGHCSWYAGVLITLATYMLFMLRNVPNPLLQTTIALSGILIALVALSTQRAGYCPLNHRFRHSQP